MFKRAVKILSLIVAMWLVSCLTIVREFKRPHSFAYGDRNTFGENDFSYEQALNRFRKKFDNSSTMYRGEVEHFFIINLKPILVLVL